MLKETEILADDQIDVTRPPMTPEVHPLSFKTTSGVQEHLYHVYCLELVLLNMEKSRVSRNKKQLLLNGKM